MKRLLWSLLGAGIFLLMLAGGVAWLGSSAEGFRWLLGQVAVFSQGKLKVEGVEGHLLMPLSVRHLEIRTDTTLIRIDHARLDWQLRALWQRHLQLRQLTVQRLVVETRKPSAEPLRVPASLRLPFGLQCDPLWIDLAAIEIKQAGPTLHFSDLRLNVAARDDAWALQLDSLVSPWATLRGQAHLAQDAPFALGGQITAARRDVLPVLATLDLKGRLEAVGFNLNAHAENMKFHASGEATPFAPHVLPHLLLAGEGIDPSVLVKDAPTALLAFSGVFEELPGKRLLGTFSLANARAGTLDRQRLPLLAVSGAVLGDARHADFSTLQIDLGAGGQLRGDGQWRDNQFALNLASERLNLAGLHRSLHPSSIRVSASLDGDARRQRVRAEASAVYGRGQFVLTHDTNKLVLESLDFRGQHGSVLTAQGNLGLHAVRTFSARFDLARFNPARFGKFPQARLNARGSVEGALAPDLRISSQFTLPPGELEGHPVHGQGRLNYAKGRFSGTALDVNLAGNQIQLTGNYAKNKIQLDWRIQAPALERLGRLGTRHLGMALHGQLNSTGSVSGDPRRPQIKLEAQAQALRLGDVTADSLQVRLDLQADAKGVFDGALHARDLTLAGQTLLSVDAALQGQRSAHTLDLRAQLPEDWRAAMRLQGGLDAAQTWSGRVLAADIQGAWPLHLLAPAALQLSRDTQRLESATFSFAGGRVALALVEHQAGKFTTRGQFSLLPVAPLLALQKPPPFTTDLVLGGTWDLRLADTLNGQLAIHRQSGDIQFTDPALKAGIAALDFDVRAVDSQITAHAILDTAAAGHVQAQGHVLLVRDGAHWGVPRSTPIDWQARASLPDLNVLRPFLPPGVKADARLKLDLAGGGTLASPTLAGTLAADDLRFNMREEGIAIREGAIKLKLDDTTVSVSEGVLQGESGRITLAGAASWRNPAGGLTLNFEKFAALNRSDRRLWLSGVTRLGYADGRVQLDGTLTADKARLEMPEKGRPELSDDVVVAGQPSREAKTSRRTPLDINVRFNLGDDFLFKGGGLDARLGGEIRVFTYNDILRGEGAIKVVKGRYAAYGQTLDITRGILTFVGPLDNPVLDILAVRKTGDVTAGVKLGGTVERPLANLYSDPAMPDTEKLSWLVLGHGLDQDGGAEFEMMQIMASALLSQAESVHLQGKLAEALSIDSFEVRSGDAAEDLSSAVVSVGKRINAKLMMHYEQSLDGLEQIVKAVYQFNSAFRVEASTGSQSSMDLFYTLEFD